MAGPFPSFPLILSPLCEFATSESCVGDAPPRMKRGRMRAERSNVNDRIDTRAVSRSNSVIRMPHKHHCLSLVDIGEARMGEFDSRLASRFLSS